MRVTPVYRLPYIEKGENLTGQIERTRFMAIDRQLEALFTFLGDGVIAGWTLERDSENDNNVVLKRGSGVIASIAAATTGDIILDGLTPNSKNYIYARLLGTTPYNSQAEFVESTIRRDSNIYLGLGTVITDSTGKVVSITDEGRVELGLISQIVGIISQHVHTGAPGEPSKIDLFNHVKGVLSAANIEDLPASKITSGVLDRNRFSLSHNDLTDTGTLTHEDLDFLTDNLQKINKILFGDTMTANMIQTILSMKHIWASFDDYNINFFSLIPGIGNNEFLSNNTFIDLNATTAEVDYIAKEIKGKFVEANEIGQVTINSLSEWETGEYDSRYVAITTAGSTYGYGYGGGLGVDYFDVFDSSSDNFFLGSDASIAFSGSKIGYGYGTFEQDNVESYAWGYGWEYATGFPESLTSTLVTLQPVSANLEIYDSISGNEYSDDPPQLFDPQNNGIGNPRANRTSMLKQASNNAAILGRRSSSINNESNPSGDNVYNFLSYQDIAGDPGQFFTENDISIIYSVWDEPYNMEVDNYMFFLLRQQPKEGSANYASDFDQDWRFDHSMDLIIEATFDNKRYFYRYQGAGGSSSTRFFDKDTKYFRDFLNDEAIDGVQGSSIIIPAQIVADDLSSDNLEYIGGYDILGELMTEDNTPSIPFPEGTWSDIRKNITGIYLTARNDTVDKFAREKDWGPIIFPQGQRTLMDPENYDDELVDGGMPVDFELIYVSGAFGFTSDINRNKIEDINISFPDQVSFNSISWVSDEPSDSIIYIQIKNNDTRSGGISEYKSNPIYTNSGDDLNSKNISGFPDIDLSDYATESEYLLALSNAYRSSGSDFPEEFSKSNSISLRVVLLPTSDSRVAPSISSITINYTSQTESGSITISTQDQWANARSNNNLTVSSEGQVSITDFQRIKNIIYGTDGRLVEFSGVNYNSNGDPIDTQWNVKETYSGDDLPQTVIQQLNSSSARISGYVTDVKILNTGKVAFLDRDSSRIIIAKRPSSTSQYQPNQIIASEFAYNSTSDTQPTVAQKASYLKAIYNPNYGEHGVLYVVFSHELRAWSLGVKTPADSGNEFNVDPSKFVIRRAGNVNDLSGSTKIVCADRGVLAFEINSTIGNLIEGVTNPILDLSFDPQSDGTAGDATAVRFVTDDIQVDPLFRIEVEIEKLTNYDLIYAPIQGVVAFDIDEDLNEIHILKRRRPYSWDTDESGFNYLTEPWYAKMSLDTYWAGEWETTQDAIDSQVFRNLDPLFFLSNIFGYKGSIEYRDPFLLVTFSGLGPSGVWLFKKKGEVVSGFVYNDPSQIKISTDGTYPMSARFDPATFVNVNDVNFNPSFYIALSDLNATGSSSRSRVIKVNDEGTTVSMKWGMNISGTNPDPPESILSQIGFATTVNDARPLLFTNDEGVIVST